MCILCKIFSDVLCTKNNFINSNLVADSTVKPRKQEHCRIRTCRQILWEKTPKYKNQIQTHLLQCSYEMVHLIKKVHQISVNNLLTTKHLQQFQEYANSFIQLYDLNCFVNNKNTIPSDIEMQSLYPGVFLTHTAYCSYIFIIVITVLVIRKKPCKCHKYPIYKNRASLSFRKACACLRGFTVLGNILHKQLFHQD